MQWSKTLRSIWRCIFEKKTRFTRNWDQHDEQKHCVYVRVFLSSMISSIFSWISQYSESNLLLATPLSKNQVHCWSVHLNNQSHWTLWEFDITLYGYILYKQTKSLLNLLYRFFCESLHLDREKNFFDAWHSFWSVLNTFVELYLSLSLWVLCDEYFHIMNLANIYLHKCFKLPSC